MKFVFDLDGTICFKGQPVSEKLLVSLEKLKARGHEVIFASARPIRDLLPILHKRFHQYAMIGGNGSMIALNGKIISTVSFNEETLAEIVQLLKMFNITYLIDSEWDYAYTGPADHPILNNLDPLKLARNIGLHKLTTVIKILMLTSDDMNEVLQRLNKMDIVVHTHGDEEIIDISPQGVDKWSGLQRLGIKEGEYIAFGNDANDITMFQHARPSIMIGDNAQLKPFATEQLILNENIETNLVTRLDELCSMDTLKDWGTLQETK
ncbi:HAD-IIB family hydrolase [Oceanobacillus polygoni]|uniref:Cof subfamily protein (Haloacid dehalogenase superfamily) n=1 Tax=Oceanobacillus polygoni TaxID=1235259 RepID=A0A9X0YTY7_9BACI|nr:HAD-IIB family hydrolase [Oceanobacillus polygoni]MBP2078262.1 Cof subfamily protein (haloacid dehalogenase superfamily) [Oceanobacillus polygoni]